MPTRTDRLDVLDGLRGLAIALVVWYHAWLVSGQPIAGVNFVAEAGFLGVDLFFFISGFCLFYPYARAVRDGRPMPSTRSFFMRRVRKIVPSYLLALATFALVYHARFASAVDAAIQLASHLTFMHTLSPATYGAISGPLWTIGVEVQFYLLFPLVCPLFRRAPLATYGALIVCAELYRWSIDRAGLGAHFVAINQLPAYLDVFGAGMIGAHVLVHHGARLAACGRRVATGLSVGTFTLAIGALAEVSALGRNASMDDVYTLVNADRLVVGPLCIVLAISTAFAASAWRRLLEAKVLAFLSLISYNLYLWNLEIAVWYHSAGFAPALTFVLAIATSIALATAITFAFERPIMAFDFRSVWPPRVVPAVPATD